MEFINKKIASSGGILYLKKDNVIYDMDCTGMCSEYDAFENLVNISLENLKGTSLGYTKFDSVTQIILFNHTKFSFSIKHIKTEFVKDEEISPQEFPLQFKILKDFDMIIDDEVWDDEYCRYETVFYIK